MSHIRVWHRTIHFSVLTEKILLFWKSGHSREVVAYMRHWKVQPYKIKMKSQLQGQPGNSSSRPFQQTVQILCIKVNSKVFKVGLNFLVHSMSANFVSNSLFLFHIYNCTFCLLIDALANSHLFTPVGASRNQITFSSFAVTSGLDTLVIKTGEVCSTLSVVNHMKDAGSRFGGGYHLQKSHTYSQPANLCLTILSTTPKCKVGSPSWKTTLCPALNLCGRLPLS